MAIFGRFTQRAQRAVAAAQQAAELNKKNLFATYNHIEAEFVEPDHAIFKLEIRPESKNPYGIVHGGAIYTMADNATGYAAHTDGRSYVTQSSAMHFLRNQTDGIVRADARVRHRGRTTCLVDVDILGEGEKPRENEQVNLFEVGKTEIINELQSLDVMALTPMDAINKLFLLREKARKL